MAEMNLHEILAHLPHRYPMLMIDHVVLREPGKRIVAIKNVSANEPYFPGHFPGRPIMPGVLILEAMAQAAGLCFADDPDRSKQFVYYYAGIDGARFKRPVLPATGSSWRSRSSGCCATSASSAASPASAPTSSPRRRSFAPSSRPTAHEPAHPSHRGGGFRR